MLIPLTSASTRQLQDLQKIAVSTIFCTLLQNLQLYANTSASTGLRILQNLQNLRFLANFTSFCQLIAKFAFFLHFFVILIPLTGGGAHILQN